jgi:hypothetical protein
MPSWLEPLANLKLSWEEGGSGRLAADTGRFEHLRGGLRSRCHWSALNVPSPDCSSLRAARWALLPVPSCATRIVTALTNAWKSRGNAQLHDPRAQLLQSGDVGIVGRWFFVGPSQGEVGALGHRAIREQAWRHGSTAPGCLQGGQVVTGSPCLSKVSSIAHRYHGSPPLAPCCPL